VNTFEQADVDVESDHQSEFNSSNTSSVIVPGDFANRNQQTTQQFSLNQPGFDKRWQGNGGAQSAD
jgi:hypothetical protein